MLLLYCQLQWVVLYINITNQTILHTYKMQGEKNIKLYNVILTHSWHLVIFKLKYILNSDRHTSCMKEINKKKVQKNKKKLRGWNWKRNFDMRCHDNDKFKPIVLRVPAVLVWNYDEHLVHRIDDWRNHRRHHSLSEILVLVFLPAEGS